MSPTGDGHHPRSTYHALNRRAVGEIEERVAKKGKRNRAYRLFHAKNDKEMIASWKLDLIRILGVFNVCSVVFIWLLLTVHSQAEVTINTNANTSTIQCDVVNTHTVVSNTHTIVSNIYHNMLQSQGETNSQHHSVSAAFCSPAIEHSPPPRLKPGQ